MGQAYPVPAPSDSTARRQHYTLYRAALDQTWLQQLVEQTDERPAFIADALSWLGRLLGYADRKRLLDELHAGVPLRLSKAKLFELTGKGPSQGHRYRTFLAAHGLVSVQCGSFNDGQPYAALFTVCLDAIADPELAVRAEAAERRRATVGEPAKERAARLSAEAGQLAADAHAYAAMPQEPAPPPDPQPPGPNRAGMGPGQNTTSYIRSRPQSSTHANSAQRARMPFRQQSPESRADRNQTAEYDPPCQDDVELTAHLVDVYLDHARCHPRRRFIAGPAAIRCAGDAQWMRIAASLLRDGVSSEHLADYMRRDLDAHDPDRDKRRSQFVDSLARFIPTMARAAQAWHDPAAARSADLKRELCDLLRSLPGPAFGGNPDARSLARELHAAGMVGAILNSHALTTALLDWVNNWWSGPGSSADDNERKLMAALKA